MRFTSTFLRWRLFNEHKRLRQHLREREQADQLASLRVPQERRRLKPTDAQWKRALRIHKIELDRRVRQGERIVAALKERLLRRGHESPGEERSAVNPSQNL